MKHPNRKIVVAALTKVVADTITYKFFADADDIQDLANRSDDSDPLFKTDEDGPNSLILGYGAGEEGVGFVAYANEPIGF